MTVSHLQGVANYETCLQVGGEHAFAITGDEMPALEQLVAPGGTVLIPFDEAHNGSVDGTWSRIARMLSDKGATFGYSLLQTGVYRVLCTIPHADKESGNSHF